MDDHGTNHQFQVSLLSFGGIPRSVVGFWVLDTGGCSCVCVCLPIVDISWTCPCSGAIGNNSIAWKHSSFFHGKPMASWLPNELIGDIYINRWVDLLTIRVDPGLLLLVTCWGFTLILPSCGASQRLCAAICWIQCGWIAADAKATNARRKLPLWI